jgi:hypothetical protein
MFFFLLLLLGYFSHSDFFTLLTSEPMSRAAGAAAAGAADEADDDEDEEEEEDEAEAEEIDDEDGAEDEDVEEGPANPIVVSPAIAAAGRFSPPLAGPKPIVVIPACGRFAVLTFSRAASAKSLPRCLISSAVCAGLFFLFFF